VLCTFCTLLAAAMLLWILCPRIVSGTWAY
jgi:hypothetical protein